MAPVYGEKDTTRERTLYDTVETHYRGLVALGVDEETYSSIVVPAILEKLPEYLRLTITRGREYLEWSLGEMLEALLKEVELREECNLTRHSRTPQSDSSVHADGNRRTREPTTASTLLTGQQPNCAFCMGNHAHEDCKVTDIKERKRLISKFGRCFNCIWKGHHARECRISANCKQCKGKHQTSLCDLASQEGRGVDVNQPVCHPY